VSSLRVRRVAGLSDPCRSVDGVSAVRRNEPCPCGSGHKFKRCCEPALKDPGTLAAQHSAVGGRIQAWAFETYPDEIRAGLDEILGGYRGVVGDAELQLVGTWLLSDRELVGGSTLTGLYARRPELPADERDVAARIAAARIGLLKVNGVRPGREIQLYDLGRGEEVSVMSQDLSWSVTVGDLIMGRVMAGPPAHSVWGPVAFVTRRTAPTLETILNDRIVELGLRSDPLGFATAIHAASREITSLFVGALPDEPVAQEAA
jgi:hypothetical protein